MSFAESQLALIWRLEISVAQYRHMLVCDLRLLMVLSLRKQKTDNRLGIGVGEECGAAVSAAAAAAAAAAGTHKLSGKW